MPNFKESQKTEQRKFFKKFNEEKLLADFDYRLKSEYKTQNLNPECEEFCVTHFRNNKISWHSHANHALSSQVCCLNFLAPLRQRPEILSRVIASAFKIEPPEMLSVGKDDKDQDIYVDFEYVGSNNYLDEWRGEKKPTRGANVTSSDAIVKFRDSEGNVVSVLIEWKYTESYGSPLTPSGNDTRMQRYANKLNGEDDPFKQDDKIIVENFFWEPFYQLMRQQILASKMEKDEGYESDKVMVLHLSPIENRKLHKLTAKNLGEIDEDAFEVFSSLLKDPSRFKATTIEDAFLPVLLETQRRDETDAWSSYLLNRYTFLITQDSSSN